MTKFYIGTSLARMQDHNRIRDLFVGNGHQLTYDWTVHGSVKTVSVDRLSEIALKETNGVLKADLVIILLPGGMGTHAELGIAIGAGKTILLHSADPEVFTACERTCAFYHHDRVLKLVCDLDDREAFLQAFKSLSSPHEDQDFQASQNALQ